MGEQAVTASAVQTIIFSDGDYAYLVGSGWQPGAKQQVARTQVIAAAKLLYLRVHGH